jgi:hypothetical protein
MPNASRGSMWKPSGNVLPVPFADNVANHRLANFEITSYVMLSFTGRAPITNATNNFVGELRFAVPFAAIAGAVIDSVGLVCLSCIPAKIAWRVVGRVAVVVARFKSGRAWANEGKKNQPMNAMTGCYSVCDKGDSEVTIVIFFALHSSPRASDNGLKSSFIAAAFSFPCRPYAAVIADAITRKSGNVSILNCRIGLRHGSLLESGCV